MAAPLIKAAVAMNAARQQRKALQQDNRSVRERRESNSKLNRQLLTGFLTVGAGVGTFLLIRGVIRKFKVEAQERQALISGSGSSYAIRLKMAFENDNYFGWGTDEDVVFEVLEEIPNSNTMNKVQKAYRDLYKRNLVTDLKDELDTAEFSRAFNIINSKFR